MTSPRLASRFPLPDSRHPKAPPSPAAPVLPPTRCWGEKPTPGAAVSSPLSEANLGEVDRPKAETEGVAGLPPMLTSFAGGRDVALRFPKAPPSPAAPVLPPTLCWGEKPTPAAAVSSPLSESNLGEVDRPKAETEGVAGLPPMLTSFAGGRDAHLARGVLAGMRDNGVLEPLSC